MLSYSYIHTVKIYYILLYPIYINKVSLKWIYLYPFKFIGKWIKLAIL